jgi:hypothetical protein
MMTKQQAEQIANGFIGSLGGNYNLVNPNDFPIVEQILLKYGFEFTEKAKQNLTEANAISSGGLFDLSLPQVYQEPNGYSLQVGYPIGSKQDKYYDYVNKGVKGVGGKNAKPKTNSGDYSFKTPYANKKMALAILLWLRKASRQTIKYTPVSNLETKRKTLGKMLTDAESKKRLAYAISSGIKRDGLRATYFIDNAIKETFNQEFISRLATALQGDIVIQIRKETK